MDLPRAVAKQTVRPSFADDGPGNPPAVPLYACDRCGFTSTAFRVNAAQAHHDAYPSCPGTIRIVYHVSKPPSELDRYRNHGRVPAGPSAIAIPPPTVAIPPSANGGSAPTAGP